MRKIIPVDAVLIPTHAKKVFQGTVFSVYQWPQQLYDGTTAVFEMLKRIDSAFVLAVKDDKIVVLNEQQPGRAPFLGLPGGKVEPGEEPMVAAAREMTEETGLVFNKYRLISVVQIYEKIEWFVYFYLATDFSQAVAPQTEAGERVEVMYMSFEEFAAAAKNNPRMGGDFASGFASLVELLKAPTFQGIPLDSEI